MATAPAEVVKNGGAKQRKRPVNDKAPGSGSWTRVLIFLVPALIFLGAIVVYPAIDTIFQSFQDSVSRSWVGLDNYQSAFNTDRIVTAFKNQVIWVAFAPAIITGLGLLFAILTERVRYSTAVKMVIFMPMAISMLAAGVIWRVMYEESPRTGFMNAAIGSVADTVGGPGQYPTARPLNDEVYDVAADGAVVTKDTFSSGDTATIGLVAISDQDMPETAAQAEAPEAPAGGLAVEVWRDFKPGGGGPGQVEDGELGMPGVGVEVRDAAGDVVASGTTDDTGAVIFEELSGEGPYQAAVAAATFSQGFGGISWLGPSLVTPAIIGAFSWMWAGFAVVVIGAGLAALPRDVIEAARVDGASEWQTFRYVTLPLLRPVLGVVFVTLMVNVLKVFDIVISLAPGASQDEANVIAVEFYRTTFTGLGDPGVGAALAVVLFLLVIPIMALNIKRFRREG